MDSQSTMASSVRTVPQSSISTAHNCPLIAQPVGYFLLDIPVLGIILLKHTIAVLLRIRNILWLQSKLLEHIESNLLTCVVIFTVGPSVFIGVNGRNRE